jgi:cytochrome c556
MSNKSILTQGDLKRYGITHDDLPDIWQKFEQFKREHAMTLDETEQAQEEDLNQLEEGHLHREKEQDDEYEIG